MRVTVQNVCQRYASASIHARDEAVVGVDGLGVVAVRARRSSIEPLRGRHEAARVAQREAALGAGRRHRDAPALVRLAEHVGVGHEHVVEEHLGEALVAVEALDRPHGDARRRAGRRGST